jgi:hypothetical protein
LGPSWQRAISVLKYPDGAIHPRGRIPVEAGKRVVGIAVVLLSARLILTPIPLSNILPAVVIALISLAYAEEAGLIPCQIAKAACSARSVSPTENPEIDTPSSLTASSIGNSIFAS